MGWTERHALFERLLAMRDGYRMSDERVGVLSIADAVRYGEAAMTALELDVEPWLAEGDESFVDEAAKPLPGRTRPRRFASDLWPWPSPWTLSSPDVPEDVNRD